MTVLNEGTYDWYLKFLLLQFPHGHMKKIMWQPARTYDQLQFHAVMWSPILTFPGSFPQIKSIRKLARKVTNHGDKSSSISLPSITQTCTFCLWLPCTCTNGYTHPALTQLHTCLHSISQQLYTFCTLIIQIFWAHTTLRTPHTQRDHPTRICEVLIIFPCLSGIHYSEFTQTAWWLLKILAVSFYTSRNQRGLWSKPYGSNSTGQTLESQGICGNHSIHKLFTHCKDD